MNEREISEIRRRLRPEKNNITHILGCYVNEKHEIISLFNQSLVKMPQEEFEAYLALFRRALSGTVGKNLIDIAFSTGQVVDSEEHKHLMALRDSVLKDEDTVRAFYEKVIQTLALEGNYLILLAHDTYDVLYRAKDGGELENDSNEVFPYILCCICPVKMTKPALSYSPYENVFHNCETGWVVSAPELGFMFPAFDDRSANIYNALYYTRDTADTHNEFIETVFKTDLPMPAAVQKETFQDMLEDTLADDCSFEVVQAVHSHMRERIETHKANKEEAPLTISKHDVRNVLEYCGVTDERLDNFIEKYDAAFGEDTEISPKNIIDNKRSEIRTPDVVIHVSPERGDLIETRIINGAKYILIRADEGVEVNGVNVHISANQ